MPESDLALAVPEWWPDAVLWLGLALFLGVAAAAAGAWALVLRLERLQGELARLAKLEEIERQLARWLGERDDLDLRRLEHLLVDLRDGSKRVEELLLRAGELRSESSSALVPLAAPNLGERVVNRLVALGYERVELVTPHQELESFAGGAGDVLVEARRDGVLCKGRVRIRAGRIDAVQLQPAFSAFP
jgi:hypothetical protein